MSVKSELLRASKEYNANQTWDTLTALREKEEEYLRTEEGLSKFRKDNEDSMLVPVLAKIVAINARLSD